MCDFKSPGHIAGEVLVISLKEEKKKKKNKIPQPTCRILNQTNVVKYLEVLFFIGRV